MVGKKTRIRKTGNLQPYSKLLPWPRWVADTTHLSHLSCVDSPMAMDARLKHGSFIGTARQLSLCRPHPGARHVWRHALEQQTRPPVHQFLQHLVKKLWGLIRDIPRAPLASPHTSLWEELLARWVKFFQSLLSSSSPVVATIARVATRELRTTSGGNNQSEPDREHRQGRGLGEDAQERAQGNQGALGQAWAAAPGAVGTGTGTLIGGCLGDCFDRCVAITPQVAQWRPQL